MKLSKKFTLVFALVTVTGSAVSFALWAANGGGPSQAKALGAQGLVVTAAAATADLYPGYVHGAVNFTVNNPNPYPITITSVTPGAITSSSPVACPSSNLVGATVSGLDLVVPAKSTSATETVPDALAMVAAAPDGCQGVTFTVAVTVSGSQT